MIHWGFIGCGDVVTNKSGKAFVQDGKSNVTAVMCRNLDKAKEFANNHNISEYYDDANCIFQNPDINAVYIATPPNSHMSYAKRALNAGKAVYVEKPMGIQLKECEEVLCLALEKKIPLYVAYYRRALPLFTHLKKLLDTNQLGQIRSVNVIHHTKAPDNCTPSWRRDPSIAGGGLFHDVACHTLDLLDFLIAPINEIHSFTDNQRKLFPSDDSVSCVFQFENGVMGTGLWCFDTYSQLEVVQIIGNEGKLEFSVFGNYIRLSKNGTTEETVIEHPNYVQESLVHNVIDNLLSQKEALSTGETAIRTQRIMATIFEEY